MAKMTFAGRIAAMPVDGADHRSAGGIIPSKEAFCSRFPIENAGAGRVDGYPVAQMAPDNESSISPKDDLEILFPNSKIAFALALVRRVPEEIRGIPLFVIEGEFRLKLFRGVIFCDRFTEICNLG